MSGGFGLFFKRHVGWMAVAMAAFFLAFAGYGAICWRTGLAIEQLRRQWTDHAHDLARSINPERVQALTFTGDDADRAEFRTLCAQMTAYKSVTGAHGIWSASLRDGRYRFGPSTYYLEDPPSFAPGTFWEFPPPNFKYLLKTGGVFNPPPQADSRRQAVTAVAPVRDPRSGHLLMVMGIEMDAGQWQTAVDRERRLPILTILGLMAILALGAGAMAWRHRSASSRPLRWRALEVYALAAFGLVLTLVAAWAFDDNQRNLGRQQFRQLAQVDFDLVIEAFRDIQTHKLEALAHFFESSQEVSRGEFRRFTTGMARRSWIEGIAWIPLVPASQLSEWQARARAEGLDHFAVWQQGPDGGRQAVSGRSIYFPVWFVEPQPENAAALGFDVGSESARRQALESAVATGLPAISTLVRLVGQKVDRQGLIVFQPIYSGEGMSKQLEGFGLAVVNIKSLLHVETAGGLMESPTTVAAFYQLPPGQPPVLIADGSSGAGPAPSETVGSLSPADPDHAPPGLTFPVFTFGQAYALVIHPSSGLLAALPVGAFWIALAVGASLTAVTAAFTHFLLRRRDLLEAQVHERTAELRATLYSIGDAVVTTDTRGRIRQMNPVAVALTGWPEAEAGGKALADVLRISSDRDEQEPNLLARVLSGQGPEGGHANEAWLMDRLGGRRPIDYSGAAIRDDRGEFGGVVLVLRDITERREAQAALHQQNDLLWRITDTSPVGIVVADGQGRVTFVNGTAETITGQGREGFIHRVHEEIPWRLLAIDGGPLTMDALPFRKVMAARGPIFDAQYALDRPDGKRVLLSVNGAPLRDTDGQICGAVFSLTDITAQQQLQENLLQAQKMESVGRLAGGVAHDFNNMLSIINGYAEMLLARMAPDDPDRGEIGEILAAGRRSESLVRQLLAFARKQTIAPVRLDLNRTVTATLKMLSRLIGEDIKLIWAPRREIWPVRIDPAQLDQILSNLVVNARDALSGGGKVTIETGTASFDAAYCEIHAGFQPGDYVLLAVSDDGCGMDRETLAHVFEPFFTTKPMGQGTGLGLATVYGIVRQNHGFINIYSEPGQGTTIKVYLPRFDEAPAVEAQAESLQGTPAGTETILLVEDEEALLKLAELLLKKLGYTVLAAATPAQAVELAHSHPGPIDLLMTDVVMPEMSGRDLWQQLSALRPTLKCLFMSGYTADVITHHGILDSGVHFLQKPFQKSVLALKLREALGSS